MLVTSKVVWVKLDENSPLRPAILIRVMGEDNDVALVDYDPFVFERAGRNAAMSDRARVPARTVIEDRAGRTLGDLNGEWPPEFIDAPPAPEVPPLVLLLAVHAETREQRGAGMILPYSGHVVLEWADGHRSTFPNANAATVFAMRCDMRLVPAEVALRQSEESSCPDGSK